MFAYGLHSETLAAQLEQDPGLLDGVLVVDLVGAAPPPPSQPVCPQMCCFSGTTLALL